MLVINIVFNLIVVISSCYARSHPWIIDNATKLYSLRGLTQQTDGTIVLIGRYTWKHPADTSNKIARNQIDCVIINKQLRNFVIWAKMYPADDVHSDHNLLLANTKIRLNTIQQKAPLKYTDTQKLKNNRRRRKM